MYLVSSSALLGLGRDFVIGYAVHLPIDDVAARMVDGGVVDDLDVARQQLFAQVELGVLCQRRHSPGRQEYGIEISAPDLACPRHGVKPVLQTWLQSCAMLANCE